MEFIHNYFVMLLLVGLITSIWAWVGSITKPTLTTKFDVMLIVVAYIILSALVIHEDFHEHRVQPTTSTLKRG